MHADVAVIGGGIAGISIASELALDRTVVVLEAEREPGLHATGRSAASYVPSYGPPMVRRLTAASLAGFAELGEEAGRPLLHPRAVVYVASAASEPRLRALLAAQAGGATRELPVAGALALCPALRAGVLAAAAIDETAADLDVAALLAAFAARLRARGGRILLGDRLHALRRRPGGWTLEAGTTTVEAAVVVDAAGAWADPVARLAGLAGLGIQPRRRTIFLSRCRATGSPAGWPFVIAADESFYFRGEGESVLVSPADATPVDAHDARPDEMEIARAIEAVNAMTTLGLRSVATAWAGLRSFSADGEPVVGHVDGAEGFIWMAGQGGYGLQMSPALARLAAAAVRGEPVPTDLAAQGVDASALRPARLLGGGAERRPA
ncbi:MAG TPA: FAD-dependent oxidoreductase [Candidatus Dormibacteraeota bacterium]|nr:FAD-dependent oxidoreductase [Candidatus Dormibacteraeota bacterium]